MPISGPTRAVHPSEAPPLLCPTVLTRPPSPARCRVHRGVQFGTGLRLPAPELEDRGLSVGRSGMETHRALVSRRAAAALEPPKAAHGKLAWQEGGVALLAFISLAADNTHGATHGKETVYTECPYKYFQCTFYTQVTETFYSSVQSLGVPVPSCRLGPKPNGDARLLSPLAQPETSPAWAAAGASGMLGWRLCVWLWGLNRGRRLTTDRQTWLGVLG